MRRLGSMTVGSVVAALAVVLATGPAYADAAQEAANKKLVKDFYAALDEAQATNTTGQKGRQIAEKFIAPGYIQHQVGGKNGREAMIENMEKARPRPPGAPGMPPAKLLVLAADGNMVVQVTSRDYPDPVTKEVKPRLIWNMFRIENGQLAEHWDVLPSAMTAPPPVAQSR